MPKAQSNGSGTTRRAKKTVPVHQKPTPVEVDYEVSFRVRIRGFGKPEIEARKALEIARSKLEMEFGDRVTITRVGRVTPLSD